MGIEQELPCKHYKALISGLATAPEIIYRQAKRKIKRYQQYEKICVMKAKSSDTLYEMTKYLKLASGCKLLCAEYKKMFTLCAIAGQTKDAKSATAFLNDFATAIDFSMNNDYLQPPYKIIDYQTQRKP